jgi:hypothetical protein
MLVPPPLGPCPIYRHNVKIFWSNNYPADGGVHEWWAVTLILSGEHGVVRGDDGKIFPARLCWSYLGCFLHIWAFSIAEIHDRSTIQTITPSGEVAAFETWRLHVAFPAKYPIRIIWVSHLGHLVIGPMLLIFWAVVQSRCD